MTVGATPGGEPGKRRPETGRAATPAELSATKAAVAARENGLATVRASAAKWQAGLGALVGVVTGSVGLGVRDTLRAMDEAWAIGLAVLLTAAFIAAFVATLLALRASGGLPRLVKTVTGREDDDHMTAKSAARFLKAAIWVTSGAVLALLGALWMSWFAPAAAEPVAVVEALSRKACGTTNIVGEYLIMTASDGSVQVFDLSEVTKWEKLSRCP